jgi:ribonucleoside-diphosphate reductase alpha chain
MRLSWMYLTLTSFNSWRCVSQRVTRTIRTLNLNHGVNITDKFMQVIERCMKDTDANDDWELINPANNEVVEVISAKYLWQKMLDLRMQTGEPYFVFIDTANKGIA